jgi:hypothetical protein
MFGVIAVGVAIALIASPASAKKKHHAKKAAATTTSSTTTTSTTTTTLPPNSVYDGHGDDVIAIKKPGTSGGFIVLATHNGRSNFIVTELDASQQRVSGLINEIGNFTGTVPLDFLSTQNGAYFQVKADGDWHFEIKPLNQARRFTGSTDGTGDDVVIYTGNAGIASITHDGRSNIIMVAYGTTRTTLVNEIGTYSGRVPMPSGPQAITIQADGHWTIGVS